VVDALEIVAAETGKTIPQIALNWLLQRPTVSTVLIGARNDASCATTSARSAGRWMQHSCNARTMRAA
jgi:aryl-alcohol dehydrogenase-like predicted oxidoreductase